MSDIVQRAATLRSRIAALEGPEKAFLGLALLAVTCAIATAWIFRSSIGETLVSISGIVVWAWIGSCAGALGCAFKVWGTRQRELATFRRERQAYIVNQTTSFDTAREPVMVFERAGTIVLANTAAGTLFGRPREEFLGRDASLLLAIGEGPADLAERLRVTPEESRVGTMREAWVRKPDGGRIPVEITLRDAVGSGGSRIGAHIRDVSERRAAQDALRESERKFRLLVNGVSDHCLFMIDTKGRITHWNDGARHLTGYDASDAIGHSATLFYTQEDKASHLLERVLKQGVEAGSFETQGWRVRKGGSAFWADVRLDALHDDGILIGFAVIMRDISERKRIEQLKDEFVSTVNHELRTPLTSIAGSLGLLAGGAGGDLPAGAARLISIAHANCQRLIRLINDMLDVEKIQSGKMRFEMARLSLGDLVRRSLEPLQVLSLSAGVDIACDASGLTDVRGDNDRLVQVVTNLVSNAIKFSPPKTSIHVTVEQSDRLVRLCVRDEGPGIPDEFRSRIFSKFSQADSSDTRQKGGTGLGLVIAKEIVDRHGGRLWFESQVGKGTSFYVDLPSIGRAAERPEGTPRTAATVLICEDDADAAAVLADVLAREGHAVEFASTIAEARAALASANDFRVLLLDLILPDGDGVVLLRELRANAATQELPVIVVSAQAERGRAAVDANALNVADWMDKPIDIRRLQQAVRSALRGVESRKPLILHVEDDVDVLHVAASALASCGEIVSVEGLSAARAFLAGRTPDLVILDIGLADGSGLELLPDISASSSMLIPVVVFSAQDDRQLLLPQVKAVMTKSRTSLEQLAQTVGRLLDDSEPLSERKIAS